MSCSRGGARGLADIRNEVGFSVFGFSTSRSLASDETGSIATGVGERKVPAICRLKQIGQSGALLAGAGALRLRFWSVESSVTPGEAWHKAVMADNAMSSALKPLGGT